MISVCTVTSYVDDDIVVCVKYMNTMNGYSEERKREGGRGIERYEAIVSE